MMKTDTLDLERPYVNNPRRWIIDRLSENVKCPGCGVWIHVYDVNWINTSKDVFRCLDCEEIIYVF